MLPAWLCGGLLGTTLKSAGTDEERMLDEANGKGSTDPQCTGHVEPEAGPRLRCFAES